MHEIQRAEVWDVVIVGGGAAGLGCALDVSLRGCKTLLLEKNDLASGTSSRSSKMIYGGVRYLKQGDISMVKGALRERDILLRNSGEIVTEQRFIIPLDSILNYACIGRVCVFMIFLLSDNGCEEVNFFLMRK